MIAVEKSRRCWQRHPEQDLQIRVVRSILAPLQAAGKITFAAFSNGFHRTKSEAGIAKAMGQHAGAWDILVWHQARCVGLEMKAGRGDQSDNQVVFAKRMDRLHGWPTYVCRRAEDVIAALEAERVIVTGPRGTSTQNHTPRERADLPQAEVVRDASGNSSAAEAGRGQTLRGRPAEISVSTPARGAAV